MPPRLLVPVVSLLALASPLVAPASPAPAPDHRSGRPNFLFVLSDDQSARYTGLADDSPVRTPAFDQLARDGVVFRHAHASSPSCSPSRASILTGLQQWQLKEASIINCGFPGDLPVYQDILWDHGYLVGYSGKGWGPGELVPFGRANNPAGIRYNRHRLPPEAENFRSLDYAANFEEFLRDRRPGQPFSFWFSTFEPHRLSPSYTAGAGRAAGLDLDRVSVPRALHDYPGMRSDIADYLHAIEVFDRQLAAVLEVLRRSGEWDNTVIVVTSDNGMPHPAAKSNLYALGTHEPLVVHWPARVRPGRVVDDLVNLADLAPTFLEVAGAPIPPAMTARSLAPVLLAEGSGRIDPARDFVVTGLEYHDSTYPMRAIRTHDFSLILNLEPWRDKWPRENAYVWGEPLLPSDQKGRLSEAPIERYYGAFREDPEVGPYVERAYGKRPPEELYDLRSDPEETRNLAYDPAYSEIKASLRARLVAHLRATHDPRFTDAPVVFESYRPYTPDVVAANAEAIRAAARSVDAHDRRLREMNKTRPLPAFAP